jgi:hypothetical protein
VAASVTLGATTPAGAVALRPNKSTDDTVCDLTHHTNAYLGSKTLVPSVASSNDQIDAYFRLAAQFITSNCRDGQLLMLQGNASSSIDTRSLNEVASSACTIASVARSDVTLTGGGMTRPGFELRCTIVKHDELVKKLEELERTDPMESLKARMYEAVRRAEGGSAAASNAEASKASSQSGRDCSKLSFSSIFYRGAPCD